MDEIRNKAEQAAEASDVTDDLEFSPLAPPEGDDKQEQVLMLGAMGCRVSE
jgi:hypothetical protein